MEQSSKWQETDKYIGDFLFFKIQYRHPLGPASYICKYNVHRHGQYQNPVSNFFLGKTELSHEPYIVKIPNKENIIAGHRIRDKIRPLLNKIFFITGYFRL